jgi:hypothetical protein
MALLGALSRALVTGPEWGGMNKPGSNGFQGNQVLGLSHPPQRKEQIMQIF